MELCKPDYVPFNEKLQHIKDLFVFQIFTGMACIDLMNFTLEHVSEQDGRKIIRSWREKTDGSFIILFLPEAEKIAGKYDYRLPKISNRKYNDCLKLPGVGAGIRKKPTTHVARHTFATYLPNRGIPVETVSRATGHGSIKITLHYQSCLRNRRSAI